MSCADVSRIRVTLWPVLESECNGVIIGLAPPCRDLSDRLYGLGLHGLCQGWNEVRNRDFPGEITSLRGAVGAVRLSARECRTATGHSRTLSPEGLGLSLGSLG